MTDMPAVVLQLSVIEVAQLAAVVEEFSALVDGDHADAAVDRLAPDAYPDDAEASREFARMTRAELLSRRSDDAGTLLRTLREHGDPGSPADVDDAQAATVVIVAVAGEDVGAWLRTLNAVRLVLATRLGIERDGDEPADDPRAFVYDWLGMLLDGIVRAVSPDEPLTAS
jgi:hypothetical protein